MASTNIPAIVNSDLRNIVMDLEVHTARGFHTRIKLGLALIKIGAKIMGITINVENHEQKL